MQEVVPVLGLWNAEALQYFRMINQPVRLQHRSGPEALRILQRDRLRLADTGGDRIHHVFRQVELRQQALFGQLVEQSALATPEDVGFRTPFPFGNAPIGDRRSGGQRTRLDGDVPFFLGEFHECGKRGIGQCLGDGGNENKFIFDRLLGYCRIQRPDETGQSNC